MPEGHGVPQQPPSGESGGGDQVPEFNLGDLGAILGGTSGGGSSGNGGGGAPADPTISAAAQFYFQLWGIKPPLGYIEGFIGAGHDLFDFMREQLARPGASKQQFFRDQYARFSSLLAQAFGKR